MGRGRPRNLRLSPVQRDVLWMLEEAHEETMATVVATLQRQFSDLTDQEVRKKAVEAVDGLVRLGLVSVAPAAGRAAATTVVLTAEGVKSLRT